jgi:hypothetical protein
MKQAFSHNLLRETQNAKRRTLAREIRAAPSIARSGGSQKENLLTMRHFAFSLERFAFGFIQ